MEGVLRVADNAVVLVDGWFYDGLAVQRNVCVR